MARPVTISDEHLLGTARAVFLEKGLHATTAEVAARAGVSEGILFKRYGSKAGLFRAAMNVGEEIGRVEQMLSDPRAVAGATPRERLARLAEHFVGVFRRIVPVAVMSIGQGEGSGEAPPGMRGPNAAPTRTIRALAAHFASEHRAGRMRVRDAEVLARVFLGSIWHFVFMDVMMGNQGAQRLSEDRFVEGLVETLIEGLEPESPASLSRRPRVRAVPRPHRGARS
jgi:AcrR family transcriptional regulator